MSLTRRSFLKSLGSAVACAAAIAYCPALLRQDRAALMAEDYAAALKDVYTPELLAKHFGRESALDRMYLRIEEQDNEDSD